MDEKEMHKFRLPPSAERALQTMYATKLGDSIKLRESLPEFSIKNTQPYVVRVDGVSFSKFTRGMVKPFDARLTNAMVSTTGDVVDRFSAAIGYHQSDEISVFFNAQQPKKGKKRVQVDGVCVEGEEESHMYSGRVQKLASVVAAYASVRLNHHLHLHDWTDLPKHISEKILGNSAHFDGRVVPCDSVKEATDCLFWRSNFDGLRNAISHIAQHYIPTKLLHKQSVINQLIMLSKLEPPVNAFELYSDQILYGTWVKKEEYTKQGVNLKTGEAVDVLRSRICNGSFNWADYSDEERNVFVSCKHWTDKHPPRNRLNISNE